MALRASEVAGVAKKLAPHFFLGCCARQASTFTSVPVHTYNFATRRKHSMAAHAAIRASPIATLAGKMSLQVVGCRDLREQPMRNGKEGRKLRQAPLNWLRTEGHAWSRQRRLILPAPTARRHGLLATHLAWTGSAMPPCTPAVTATNHATTA